MITIKVRPEHNIGLQNNDLRILKEVIDENHKDYQKQLNNTAKFEDFRFYQGVVQTLDGLKKLMPA